MNNWKIIDDLYGTMKYISSYIKISYAYYEYSVNFEWSTNMLIDGYKVLLWMMLFASIESAAIKRFRIRDIRCETTGKSITVNFCYIKSYKRTSYYSIGLNVTRKIENGKLTTIIERKLQTDNYDKILNLENIEFCRVVLGKEISLHSAILLSINHLKQFGNLNDVCGKSSAAVNLLNVTWDTFSLLQTFPGSEYIWNFKWFDDIDEKILNLRLFGNII